MRRLSCNKYTIGYKNLPMCMTASDGFITVMTHGAGSFLSGPVIPSSVQLRASKPLAYSRPAITTVWDSTIPSGTRLPITPWRNDIPKMGRTCTQKEQTNSPTLVLQYQRLPQRQHREKRIA